MLNKLKSITSRLLLKGLARLNAPSDRSLRADSATRPVRGIEWITEFSLDDLSLIGISQADEPKFPRWLMVQHCEEQRMSLTLSPGERMSINGGFHIEKDMRLFIRLASALPAVHAKGLSLAIWFHDSVADQSADLICDLHVSQGRQPPVWRTFDIDLSFLSGRQGGFSFWHVAGNEDAADGNLLAISDLCIARVDRLELLKARSFQELRARNEIAHFSHVYRHSMYATVQKRNADSSKGTLRGMREFPGSAGVSPLAEPPVISILQPGDSESAYEYAMRLLARHIPQPPPKFQDRLKALAGQGKRMKVLSLCCGAARIEAGFAANAGPDIAWSLLDINAELLQIAARQFSPDTTVDLLVGDVNRLVYSGEKWDVILCVSGLHHVVELERLVEYCHRSLNPEGEFWSIGEYVGQNGNRLWPDARAKANEIFGELPEQLRLNRHTGCVDLEIPDNDCSVGCFEGIRSAEILSILDRWFLRVDVYQRNCFLWRLVNLAYSDNFNLHRPEHRQWIAKMVQAEVEHFRGGGQGTELFGVFRPRMLFFEN
jgi:SAM-dependent methyltransferase